MAAPSTCTRCGSGIPALTPGGLCPNCWEAQSVEITDPGPIESRVMASDPSSVPDWPTVAFAGESVLRTMSQSSGPLPRVRLPDSEASGPSGPFAPPPLKSARSGLSSEGSGRLRILGEIARGGMGAVLKGHDPDLGRDLAIKVLLEQHSDRPEMLRRFIEEAQIAGQLQHPGVVPVYEMGSFDENRPYFTMKLVKGRTLSEVLADRPHLAHDLPRFLETFKTVCQTMAYAHTRGVIHRDLKPSNVMVGAFGEIQVMDWGLAKVLVRGVAAHPTEETMVHDKGSGVFSEDLSMESHEDDEPAISTSRTGDDSDLSMAGSVLGTPPYMPPEQARGEFNKLDERCDVFALGSILCEVLTGKPAFTGRNSVEVLRKAARGDVNDAFARLDASGADPDLVTLTKDCLAPTPEKRPANAGAVAGRLIAYTDSVHERMHQAELAQAAERARAEEAKRTATAAEARAKAERDKRLLTIVTSVLCVVVITVFAISGYWVQSQRIEMARREVEVEKEKAERLARSAKAIDDAMADAQRLRSAAQVAVTNDMSRWTEALAAARRADALAAQGETDETSRARVAAFLSEVIREHGAAQARVRQIELDKTLMASLETVRGSRAEHNDLTLTDKEYAEAFKAAGLNIEMTETQKAGAWIAGHASPVELASYLDDWARVRRLKGDNVPQWRRLLEIASIGDPDRWRTSLRMLLAGRQIEVFRRLADEESTLAGQPAPGLVLLALELKEELGDRARAERVLRHAWRIDPSDVWVNYELARVRSTGSDPREMYPDPAEAVRYLSSAVSARPNSPLAHHSLGFALLAQGRWNDAADEFRKTLSIQPNHIDAQTNLGYALKGQGKLEEAAQIFRVAIATLQDPEMKKTNPNSPNQTVRAINNLGIILKAQGKVDEAIAQYREALRLNPSFSEGYFNLGMALQQQGHESEAVDTFRKGATTARKGSALANAFAKVLELAERRTALTPRLAAVLAGQDKPKDNAERVLFAELCASRRLHAAAARFYADAFALDPALGNDRAAQHVYKAACSAAKAGCGRSADDPPPSQSARAEFRRLAQGWLGVELSAWSHAVDSTDPAVQAGLREVLGRWRSDPDLACVRDAAALAELPEAERAKWRLIWAGVESVLDKANSAP